MAEESGLTAAFVALPGNMLMSVDLTVILTTAKLLDHTLLTNEVLLLFADHVIA